VARTSHEDGARRTFFALVGLVAGVAFLYWARAVLIPVALALLLSFALGPLVSFLQRRGLGRIPSTLLVVALALAAVYGVGEMVWVQVGGIARRMPAYRGEIKNKLAAFRRANNDSVWADLQAAVNVVAEELNPPRPGPPPDAGSMRDGAAAQPVRVIREVDPWERLWEIAGPTAELVVGAALVVVLVIFMLAQRENLRNRLLRLTGRRNLVAATRALDEGADRVSKYLLVQLFINCCFGVVLAIVLVEIGAATNQPEVQQTALFWGFLAGLARYVPYLGTWVAGALLFIFCIAALPGWSVAFLVFGVFALMEFISGNFLEPLLYGKRIGSSPLALLLAAAFWTFLWGPVGLLLSTPLTVVLVVLGKYVPPLEFLAVALGDEEVLKPNTAYYQRLLARDQDDATEVAEQHLKDHSRQELYEDVLLPALSRAREDLRDGELDEEGYRFVIQGTRALVDDVADHQGPVHREGPAAIALPARDDADALALEMLRDVLAWSGRALEIVRSERELEEAVDRLGTEQPLLLLGVLGPGGVSAARSLCRRLRTRHPHARLLVGRWGVGVPGAEERQRLEEAGADEVSATLHETRSQLLPSPIPEELPERRPTEPIEVAGPARI
jgi:predicted PurR-regulated permease PerM